MSLSSALSVALSGLQTSSALLQITSNNISNAQTPGYTKKTANLSSTALGGTAGGVEISSYVRATDTVLQQSFNNATSDASLLSTQNGYMKQVQTILNSNANNPALSDAIAKFSAAWTQLQAAPEDSTVQAAVVAAGNTLAKTVNTIALQVGTLRSQVSNDITSTVTQLNTDLAAVQRLNEQIFAAQGNHDPTGNLEDERDQAINQIASITGLSIFPRAQGQVALYTIDGTVLLDGVAQTFTYNGNSILNSSGQDVTNDLSGGSLQGALQFIATATTPSSLPGVNTIQKLQAQLVDLVKAFTTNSAGPPQTFANAYNPTNTSGADFFTAISNDPSTFAVDSSLISDPTGIPEANVANVAASFSNNFNFTDSAAGFSLSSGTYTTFVTTMLSGFQQAANTISNQSTSATQQATYYQQSLANATGVNVDEELVNLTTLQNSYAASAHVISTISDMFKTLLNTI